MFGGQGTEEGRTAEKRLQTGCCDDNDLLRTRSSGTTQTTRKKEFEKFLHCVSPRKPEIIVRRRSYLAHEYLEITAACARRDV